LRSSEEDATQSRLPSTLALSLRVWTFEGHDISQAPAVLRAYEQRSHTTARSRDRVDLQVLDRYLRVIGNFRWTEEPSGLFIPNGMAIFRFMNDHDTGLTKTR
jgi:hypothetical protein